MNSSQRTQQQSAGTVRRRGVVVFLGNRTGLIRADDSQKQILFRLAESDIEREGLEVEFNAGADPRNGQAIATNVRPIRGAP